MEQTTTAKAEGLTHKHKYIFPNFMAKMMANVDPKTQYESAMLSSFLILIGLFITSIGTIFFMDFDITYKFLIAVNSIGGFMYISSSLVTVYQQYSNYMDIMEIQKTMAAEAGEGPINIKPKKKVYNRLNQFIFLMGILSVISAITLAIPKVSNKLIASYPGLNGLTLWISGLLLIFGIVLMGIIFKKGRDKMKKIARIEQLIREGKLRPKSASAPVQKTVQQTSQSDKTLGTKQQKVPSEIEVQKRTLAVRLKQLIGDMKSSKEKGLSAEEKRIQEKLQVTLDEIKRLKLAERRTNNSTVVRGY